MLPSEVITNVSGSSSPKIYQPSPQAEQKSSEQNTFLNGSLHTEEVLDGKEDLDKTDFSSL